MKNFDKFLNEIVSGNVIPYEYYSLNPLNIKGIEEYKWVFKTDSNTYIVSLSKLLGKVWSFMFGLINGDYIDVRSVTNKVIFRIMSTVSKILNEVIERKLYLEANI